MTDAAGIKQALRHDMRCLQASLSHEWLARNSSLIQEQAGKWNTFEESSCIGLYAALPFEVSTGHLIEAAWAAHKQVVIPAAVDGEYLWVEYNPGMERVPGPFQVTQPSQIIPFCPQHIELFFIPGVAFDTQGHRLGHGKGIYDRLLLNTEGHRCGLAFTMQILEDIPCLDHDMVMHSVLTESGRLQCGA